MADSIDRRSNFRSECPYSQRLCVRRQTSEASRQHSSATEARGSHTLASDRRISQKSLDCVKSGADTACAIFASFHLFLRIDGRLQPLLKAGSAPKFTLRYPGHCQSTTLSCVRDPDMRCHGYVHAISFHGARAILQSLLILARVFHELMADAQQEQERTTYSCSCVSTCFSPAVYRIPKQN